MKINCTHTCIVYLFKHNFWHLNLLDQRSDIVCRSKLPGIQDAKIKKKSFYSKDIINNIIEWVIKWDKINMSQLLRKRSYDIIPQCIGKLNKLQKHYNMEFVQHKIYQFLINTHI